MSPIRFFVEATVVISYGISDRGGGHYSPVNNVPPKMQLADRYMDSLVFRPRGGRGRGYSSQRYDVNSNH